MSESPKRRGPPSTSERRHGSMNCRTSLPAHRFPPPWSVEEGETYFVVKDNDGQQLAYVYFEEPGRPSHVPGRSIKLTSGGDLSCDQSFYCAPSLS